MQLKITKTDGKHIRKLVKIGNKYWKKEGWVNASYMKNTLKYDGVHLTALLYGKIAGSIMIVKEAYPRYWIYYFAVDKNHGRKGIGTTLLKDAEKRLSKGTFLLVDLEKSDTSGMKFYKKNGFRIMGKVNNWFSEMHTGIIMGKKIE